MRARILYIGLALMVVLSACGSQDEAPAEAKEPTTETSCTDGVDNDGDELVDCDDTDCECLVIECSDGEDNDGDGLIDCYDPDCGCEAVCDDGIDNDGDGLTDCDDDDCGC